MRILSKQEAEKLDQEFHFIIQNKLDCQANRLKEVYDILNNSFHSQRDFELKIIDGGKK